MKFWLKWIQLLIDYGILYYRDGKIIYEGEFKNDKKHGHGILYYQDGNKFYEGSFTNDAFYGHGKATYYNDEKIIYEGEWIECNPVETWNLY